MEEKEKCYPLVLSHKTFKKNLEHQISSALQIDCDQTVMGLPPVTFAVFLIAN
jgi:hypothetical protein